MEASWGCGKEDVAVRFSLVNGVSLFLSFVSGCGVADSSILIYPERLGPPSMLAIFKRFTKACSWLTVWAQQPLCLQIVKVSRTFFQGIMGLLTLQNLRSCCLQSSNCLKETEKSMMYAGKEVLCALELRYYRK